MSKMAIDKEKFLELLQQLVLDVSFEHEVVLRVLNQMPDNYRDTFLTEYFFTKIYKQPYYLVQHATFAHIQEYLITTADVIKYLNKWNVEERPITHGKLLAALGTGMTIAGHKVYHMNMPKDASESEV